MGNYHTKLRFNLNMYSIWVWVWILCGCDLNQSSHDGKPLAELFQPFVPTHHDPPSLKKFFHIRLFMSVTDEKKTEKLWPIHPQAQDGTDDISISIPVFLSSFCMIPIPFFE